MHKEYKFGNMTLTITDNTIVFLLRGGDTVDGETLSLNGGEDEFRFFVGRVASIIEAYDEEQENERVRQEDEEEDPAASFPYWE